MAPVGGGVAETCAATSLNHAGGRAARGLSDLIPKSIHTLIKYFKDWVDFGIF